MIDTVIFLGAGASVAEGASSQANLFKDYFWEKRRSREPIDEHLIRYFRLFWQIDLKRKDPRKITFPTFEEALGILEMARDRGEGFHWFYNTPNSNGIGHTIEDLVFLIAEILHRRLKTHVLHEKMVQRLIAEGRVHRTAFISLNYDILIDNALTSAHPTIELDYGLDFANFAIPGDWQRPRPGDSVSLLKIHGSLNWLYCPVCKGIWITPKEKGVITLISRTGQRQTCRACEGRYVPVLIPPTFFKAMSNPHLVTVWEKAECILRSCKRIVFCGYSLPDADMHIKYLLKRGQMNRKGPAPQVVVINNFPGKVKGLKDAERGRYVRLFGEKKVDYSSTSFQEFASDPNGAYLSPF